MVRSASSVTRTRQWPVTTSPGTAGVGIGSKATPIERMSWVKAWPELVVGHPAEEGGPAAQGGHAGRGVGRRAARGLGGGPHGRS